MNNNTEGKLNIINKIFYLGDPQRKIILINPEFQLKIITTIAFFFMGIIGLFFTMNWYFFYQLKQNGIKAGIPIESEYFNFVSRISHQFNIFFFITALVCVFFIYYFGLILSHRISGPIFKINKSIDEMIETKKIIKLNFRKNDYFHEHAHKINELLEKIDRIQ
jgi:hypothetical protein